jgi:hypothetical protein
MQQDVCIASTSRLALRSTFVQCLRHRVYQERMMGGKAVVYIETA